jgi:hypothetical protein
MPELAGEVTANRTDLGLRTLDVRGPLRDVAPCCEFGSQLQQLAAGLGRQRLDRVDAISDEINLADDDVDVALKARDRTAELMIGTVAHIKAFCEF